MKTIAIAFSALTALFGAQALAADLPVPRAPLPVVVPLYNWTGCHVGGDVGFAWAYDKDDETVGATGGPSPFSPGTTNISSPNGAKLGGYAGCDYQFASRFVAGVEGDGEWANIRGGNAVFPNSGPPLDFYETRINSETSARVRIGYAYDRGMGYLTGGAAWAHITERDVIGATGAFQDTSTTRPGWTAGFGFEYAFLTNLVGRIEYRYSDFGTFSYVPNLVFPQFVENHKISENAVRVGLSYKFGLPFGY